MAELSEYMVNLGHKDDPGSEYRQHRLLHVIISVAPLGETQGEWMTACDIKPARRQYTGRASLLTCQGCLKQVREMIESDSKLVRHAPVVHEVWDNE